MEDHLFLPSSAYLLGQGCLAQKKHLLGYRLVLMFRHLETGAVIKAGAVILPPLSFKWIYIFLRAKQHDASAQRYNRQILETLKADKAQTSCPHPSQITEKQWEKAPHPGVWDTITKNNLGEKTGFFFWLRLSGTCKRFWRRWVVHSQTPPCSGSPHGEPSSSLVVSYAARERLSGFAG